MGLNAIRIALKEGRHTWVSSNLEFFFEELDMRLNHADCFAVYTYTSGGINDGLMEKAEYFKDAAHSPSLLAADQTVTRATGSDGIQYISGIVSIYYNSGLTEDSRVTTTVTRDGNDRMIECANVFSTSESTSLC